MVLPDFQVTYVFVRWIINAFPIFELLQPLGVVSTVAGVTQAALIFRATIFAYL
jgi:hypothetical protein